MPDKAFFPTLVPPYWRLMLVEQVVAAIREVGAVEVMPRFRALADGDIMEKSPGDLVTIADQECERVLIERLRAIRDLPCVGEEGTAADPSLLDQVASCEAAWIIDPIDGTANFVAGNSDFAIMVGLVEAGETVAAWIWHPETDVMLTAQRGRGVQRNGVALPPVARSAGPTGILKRFRMDEPARSRLAHFPANIGQDVAAFKSAGIEYAALVTGTIDFLFYWRTLPWDHAPGGLIASEAGLKVARPDGSRYLPGDGRSGLLSAPADLWDRVASQIRLALAP